MHVKKRLLDPYGLAERILPKLESLSLVFSNGRFHRTYGQPYPKAELEAIVSRCLRVELDDIDPDRPVTSALVREVTLALAALLSPLATRLAAGRR
jgi:hypothetical protein